MYEDDYLFDEPDKITVDRVVFDGSFLTGSLNGAEVIKSGPYSDMESAAAAMPLYDKDGNKVLPETAPPDL